MGVSKTRLSMSRQQLVLLVATTSEKSCCLLSAWSGCASVAMTAPPTEGVCECAPLGIGCEARMQNIFTRQTKTGGHCSGRKKPAKTGTIYTDARALHCAHGRKANHCITLSRCAWLHGQKTAIQQSSSSKDNPARMCQQSACNCL